MTYRVKEAAYHHSKRIAEFQIQMAMETEQIHLGRETVLKGVASVFEKPELGRYFVAEINNEIVASLLITYEWSDWRNARIWWIQSVYVVPEHRRKGIFRLMYSHIRSIVENNKDIGGIRLYVDKTNINAQKTYDHIGMNGEHYQLYEWMKE